MKYNSVDEIDTISFRDAAIVRCVFSAKQGILEFELDGAMVRENNSANELFSDRYVRDMQVRFVNPEVEAILLEGHKYYDANDVLQSEVPDYELSVVETAEFPKSCEGAYLFEMKQDADGYVLGIEFVDPEDQTVGDSYQVYVTGTQVAMLWEQYMNRVQS